MKKLESEWSPKYWIPFSGTFKTLKNFKYGKTLLNDSPKDLPKWKNALRISAGVTNIAEQGACWFGLYVALWRAPEIYQKLEGIINSYLM